jgi:Na+/phosphate symporter
MEGLWSALPIILEILLPIISLLVAWFVTVLAKKFKLQNTAQVDFLIETAVKRAVDAVEQLSKVAKRKGEEALSSGDKLAKGIAIVEAELRTLGLPKLTSEVITARIESFLGLRASWEEEEEKDEEL